MWGIPPSDFWAMDLEEWWWLYESKKPRDGSLSESDLQELYELIQ